MQGGAGRRTGLSARRVRRTKSRGPKRLQLEVPENFDFAYMEELYMPTPLACSSTKITFNDIYDTV